ncbi:MAG: protein kinase domain-containing protein, partial [Gemmataceae bacterium]
MSKPATVPDVLRLLKDSRLIPDEKLLPLVASWTGVEADSLASEEILRRLLKHGLLTPFQAGQLKAGRWKGFFIGKYKVRDRLGSGGMGQVFLGEHVQLGCKAAIKVLHPKFAERPDAMKRFIREAKAACRLEHPNVVQVLDIATNVSPPYLVMEYVQGVTLQSRLAKEGLFEPGEAADYIQQIARGL